MAVPRLCLERRPGDPHEMVTKVWFFAVGDVALGEKCAKMRREVVLFVIILDLCDKGLLGEFAAPQLSTKIKREGLRSSIGPVEMQKLLHPAIGCRPDLCDTSRPIQPQLRPLDALPTLV